MTHGRRSAASTAWLVACAALGALPALAAVPQLDDGLRQKALALLHRTDTPVTYDALSEAIGRGDPDVAAALLDAGLVPGPADLVRERAAILNGLVTACGHVPVPTQGLGDALAAVVGHGFPVGDADELGNTLLLSAAQFCPAQVVSSLLDLGAPVGPVNKQNTTPLQMAMISGKWSVVRVLVDHGARMTRADVEQTLFDPPDDPDVRALIERATR